MASGYARCRCCYRETDLSPRAFEPVSSGALLIMHGDGLATHGNLANYPGLAARRPGLIAGVLYRDHERKRDDVTVVVIANKAIV